MFKKKSDIVDSFKAAGCHDLPGGSTLVKEKERCYGEYAWEPASVCWVKVGEHLSVPANAIEWIEFNGKDGIMTVTNLVTGKTIKFPYYAPLVK